jgi:TolB protein
VNAYKNVFFHPSLERRMCMQTFYTVQPGDTLANIASRWNIPIASLIAANNLTPPYTLFIGQQLSMPPGVDVYRVQTGDSVYRIAQKFRVPLSVIISANHLAPPYTLQEGQLLKVPPGFMIYVVQPGDTLFKIARRFNVTTGGQVNFELIREVNGLPSYQIWPGTRLIIPYAPPGGTEMLAYFTDTSGSYDLWLYNPINGQTKQITSNIGESFSVPYWSPDASKIAFVGKNGILFVVNLQNNTIARLDQFAEGLGVFIDWSPDGQKLIYTHPNKIIIYHVASHQVQTFSISGVSDAQWFPNGQEILFQAPDEHGVSQLYRIQADGTKRRQITRNTGGRLNHVRISPDSTHALYTTPGASISIIYIVDLATGNTVEIEGGPLAKNYNPTWSPNGNTLAYSATNYEELGYFNEIRTVESQGGNDTIWAISDCFASLVTWTLDGRKIAYISGCNGQGAGNEIWLIDLQHPVPIRLVEGGNIVSLQWSKVPFTHRSTFRNENFRVQFLYPSHWQQVNEERYEGQDGFFQISALYSDAPIHTVCQNEAFHMLMPYGSNPQIKPTNFQGQDACFIFPSADQPSEMRGQAALIILYPNPIEIGNTTYNYFILWASQAHIVDLGRSIVFL